MLAFYCQKVIVHEPMLCKNDYILSLSLQSEGFLFRDVIGKAFKLLQIQIFLKKEKETESVVLELWFATHSREILKEIKMFLPSLKSLLIKASRKGSKKNFSLSLKKL